MLKTKALLLEPDPRNDLVIVDVATGAQRPMRIDDLHSLVENIELSSSVPPAICHQFDVARHAFIYSWFEYELVTLAEAHSYAALEAALRSPGDPLPRIARAQAFSPDHAIDAYQRLFEEVAEEANSLARRR